MTSRKMNYGAKPAKGSSGANQVPGPQGESAPATSLAAVEIDLDGRIASWSPDAADMFDLAESDALGRAVFTLFARKVSRFPDDALLAQIRAGSDVQPIELRLRRGQDQFFDAQFSLTFSPPNRIAITVAAVAARQRSEGALRRSEERLRYALEAASDGLWDWDLQTGQVVFSHRVSTIFGEVAPPEGTTVADVESWDARIHPDDEPLRRATLDAHLEGRTPAYESEYRLRGGDGWKWVLVRGRVTERSATGKPRRMIGTITDVSERKFAQEALRQSEQRYRNLFEHASDSVVLFEADTKRILDANRKAEQMLGYSSTALQDMTFFDIHPADQKGRIEEALERSSGSEGSIFEIEGLASDGTRIPVETSTRLVNYAGRQVFQSFIRDISQRRTLEDQLRHSQKMETLGRLAGGIAHDFNNLLTAIQGYSSLLKSSLDAVSEEHEMAEEISRTVQRASRLTTQLVTFSRRQIPNPASLDLNAIVKETEGMLERLIDRRVELETSLDPELCSIRGNRGSIEQVITNLVVNAADAMRDGRRLEIRTGNVKLAGGPSQPQTIPDGDYVTLSVRDDGEGMAPETLSHIFEPFFTTKAPGSGTGLGLATVYDIIKQCQGFISVTSEPGEGTEFQIYFPREPAES